MFVFRVIKKFSQILNAYQKSRVILLTLLMIFGGVLETCSVSLIVPFMNAVINPEDGMKKKYAQIICRIFNIESANSYLIILATLISLLFIFKNLYLAIESNIQHKFVYGNMFTLQEKLLEAFIYRPYEYFLNATSGEIIRVVSADTREAFEILVMMLSMFSELVVSMMLIAAIFIIAPIPTMCIAVMLLLLLLIIIMILKPILHNMGVVQQKSAAGMNKWLLQSIHGIKELKVMQKERFFLDSYSNFGKKYIYALRMNQTLSVMPRFTIEGVSMGTMFIFVAIMIGNGIELSLVIPMLTAVVMATIRLLPSINRISQSLNRIAYGEPMLDKVIEHVQAFILRGNVDKKYDTSSCKYINTSVIDNANNFEFKNITYHYPNSEQIVLSSTCLSICKGETIGIVGASGAGKTTLADIILGLLTPQSGQFFIDNIDITDSISSLHSQIGYIPQSIFMLDDTIAANIAFGVATQDIDQEKLKTVVREAALESFISELPEGLNTQIGERGVRLSGGQRQRIGIARALYREPSILILDEATSALDNETEGAIMESINHLKGKKTMIIIAHRLTTIENCDHVYRVENGKIIKER